MRESDFNQFVRLKNQLVVAEEYFGRDQSLSRLQITTMSKDMEERLKLVDKAVDVVERPNRWVPVALLRYNAEKPENSHAQIRLFARKKNGEFFNKLSM